MQGTYSLESGSACPERGGGGGEIDGAVREQTSRGKISIRNRVGEGGLPHRSERARAERD